MKKITVLIVMLLVSNSIFSQKALTRLGEVKFEASMPSALEEIAAKNTTVSSILDKTNGEIVVLVLIKSFRFKSALMEEHFNENYMESLKYPKSNFKGKIINFDASKLSAKAMTYDLVGDITIHGVTKKISTKINLLLAAGKINATTDFLVNLEDYKIEVPSLVKDKIAKNVKIALNLNLE